MIIKETTAIELVAGAYSAGAEPALWPRFLGRLAAVVCADSCTLQLHDLEQRSGSIAISSGLEPSILRAYEAHYAALNPWVSRGRSRMSPGAVLTSEMALSTSELEATEYYTDFLRPQGLRHSLAGVVRRDESASVFFAFQLSKTRGAATGGDRALVEWLMPHLTRAVEIHRRLGAERQRGEALIETANRSPWAVVFLDRRARIVFANDAARKLSELLLQRALDVAVRGGCAVPRDREPPLSVTLAPLSTADTLVDRSAPAYVVCITDPARSCDAPERWLREGYGLTRAEARLAIALSRGQSLEAIAHTTNTGVATLRTHLKRTFDKTGTRRQSDLVRLVVLAGGIDSSR